MKTAKEFLEQYREATRRAKRLEEEYRAELELIDSIRSPLGGDGLPHGNGINRSTEDKAIRLAEKARRYKEAQAEAMEIRQTVFDFINSIRGIEGAVLTERYINLRKWEDVAEVLSYSVPGIHNVHQRALLIVEERLNK
jgi:DNA-directed RNA polymerase specialized sigma24 family protein